MADMFDPKTGTVHESVHTPDGESRGWVVCPRYLHENVPHKYIKAINGTAVEMEQAEKDTVDAALVRRREEQIRQSALDEFKNSSSQNALLDLFIEELNEIRNLAGLPQLTERSLYDRQLAKISDATPINSEIEKPGFFSRLWAWMTRSS